MTKDWERYKEAIQSLYAEHTLATVRQMMEEQYSFKASIRAYRGRLDRWRITKYKKRKSRAPSHDSSVDAEFISISASPSKSDSEASSMIIRPVGRGTGAEMGAWHGSPIAQTQTQMQDLAQPYDEKGAYARSEPLWQYGLGEGRGLYSQSMALQEASPARGLRHPTQAYSNSGEACVYYQTFLAAGPYRAAPPAMMKEMNGQGDPKGYGAKSEQLMFRPPF